MVDASKIKESEFRLKEYISDGIIKTKENPRFVNFFLSNANKSLNSANALYDLSTDKKMQENTGYLDFDGLLWVVNACYYSMFYMARALLESEGIRIKSQLSIHAITFDAIIGFFYLNGKLEKRLLTDFAETMEDANEILGKQKFSG